MSLEKKLCLFPTAVRNITIVLLYHSDSLGDLILPYPFSNTFSDSVCAHACPSFSPLCVYEIQAYARVHVLKSFHFLQEEMLVKYLKTQSQSTACILARSLQHWSGERARQCLTRAPNHISPLGRPVLARHRYFSSHPVLFLMSIFSRLIWRPL